MDSNLNDFTHPLPLQHKEYLLQSTKGLWSIPFKTWGCVPLASPEQVEINTEVTMLWQCQCHPDIFGTDYPQKNAKT
ncbi:hypothetical protein [uncultured Rubinisphaera sp.]|uniref:hypothetical protein n=1 Tax=uncultured Rubinisphaera sp. TaxID=1678686 RepID=UPI0030D7B1DC